jgi:hypothetical protein
MTAVPETIATPEPATAATRSLLARKAAATRSLLARKADAAKTAAARWWAFTDHPVSIRTYWRLSRAVVRRPNRLLLFTLLLLLPTACTGPLLALVSHDRTTEPIVRPEPTAWTPAEAAQAAAARNSILEKKLAAWRKTIRRSWPITTRPAKLGPLWRRSGSVGPRPADSDLLAGLWMASNLLDRPLLFAASFACPAILVGPIRWCVARPTRRIGLYNTTFILLAVTGG